jgi:hypothetical protein
MKTFIGGLIAIIVIVGGVAGFLSIKNKGAEETAKVVVKKYEGKKVLYVNSYHKGFEWSDGEQTGAEKIINGTGAEFKPVYMDAKNNPSEEFGKTASLSIKQEIESYKPDVLIVADDAAFKYLIQPYYKDASLPVVFAGINWDLSAYNGPYLNTTGMLEIALYQGMVDRLKTYAKGGRIGFLSGDNISEYKNADFLKKNVYQSLDAVYVKDFSEWKKQYVEIQKRVDILIVGISAGIKDWDNAEAEKFVLANTKVPTGTEQSWMMPFSMLGYTKIPQEQGETAGTMTLDILGGKKVQDIPIVFNKKGSLFVNLKIAETLGVVISPELLKNATIVQ